jgi:hypothetical protein
MPRLSVRAFLLVGIVWLAATPAQAFFHEWEIKEVYTNADGSMQYVELQAFLSTEIFATGAQIVATSDGDTRTFTFPGDLPAVNTLNRHLLIASPGFERLAGAVTPDFYLPSGLFFDPGAASITITINHPSLPGIDTMTFAGASLPTNGRDSLTDTTIHTPTTTLVASQSSPTNYNGAAGALPLDVIFLDGFEGGD